MPLIGNTTSSPLMLVGIVARISYFDYGFLCKFIFDGTHAIIYK